MPVKCYPHVYHLAATSAALHLHARECASGSQHPTANLVGYHDERLVQRCSCPCTPPLPIHNPPVGCFNCQALTFAEQQWQGLSAAAGGGGGSISPDSRAGQSEGGRWGSVSREPVPANWSPSTSEQRASEQFHRSGAWWCVWVRVCVWRIGYGVTSTLFSMNAMRAHPKVCLGCVYYSICVFACLWHTSIQTVVLWCVTNCICWVYWCVCACMHVCVARDKLSGMDS